MRPTDIPKLMANFAKDMSQIAQGALKGDPILAPSAFRQANLAICRANSCGYYIPTQDRCRHPNCGCFCAAKTIFAVLKCPANLW